MGSCEHRAVSHVAASDFHQRPALLHHSSDREKKGAWGIFKLINIKKRKGKRDILTRGTCHTNTGPYCIWTPVPVRCRLVNEERGRPLSWVPAPRIPRPYLSGGPPYSTCLVLTRQLYPLIRLVMIFHFPARFREVIQSTEESTVESIMRN